MPGCECSSRFACAADRSRHAEPVETATQRATRRRTYPTPRRPAPKGRAPHRRRPQPARTIPPTTPTSTPTTRPAPITRRNRPSPARTPHRLPTREKCGLGVRARTQRPAQCENAFLRPRTEHPTGTRTTCGTALARRRLVRREVAVGWRRRALPRGTAGNNETPTTSETRRWTGPRIDHGWRGW